MTAIDIIVDEFNWKKKILVATTSDFGDSNSNSKPRSPKFLSFLLLMGQVILNDLQIHL